MNNRVNTLALAAALAATFSGCADMKVTSSGPVPEVRIAQVPNPDTILADAVRAELTKMNAKDVSVAVKGGEVTLKGAVKDGQQLVQIATAIQKMPGVKAVIPDVDVK